jgi:serine/threonine protein kinase
MASADRLIEVFNEAKARPLGAERDLFLSEACHSEPTLKEQVLALLQAHEGAGDFLKYTQAIPPVTPLTEKPGDKIGRYKLLQQIGEGGCGVVYMAEQEEPVRRRVAFKVIKLGMDTKQVVARFEAEGQALAMMDHPNIAKVFDAGATTTGRPYFVMELVRGIKITEYCDQNNLPTEARLKLFTQVCHAIQHAHQKGIIHRDIKPSNILVTVNDGMPVPKVIDFGIAKAIEQRLTDKTVFTAFEQFIGTPAYMSPEQAEMTSLDIDTRADIYSLGVLLYELLSGNTPFDAEKLVASGVAEIRRIIREQEPPKPSTRLNTLNDADLGTVASRRQTDPPKLMHLIRGDLDWIVMKCLEKDRTRRYETANGLAVDIQRHLSNEPVVARPPSNLYRFQKLVRRNKLTFAATSAVIAALVLGLGLSTWMFFKEKQARQRAVAAEQKARSEATKSQQFAQFLQDMLNKLGLNLMDDKFVDQGKLAEAELMLKEQLAKRRELLGNEHPDVASSLNTLTLAQTIRLRAYKRHVLPRMLGRYSPAAR